MLALHPQAVLVCKTNGEQPAAWRMQSWAVDVGAIGTFAFLLRRDFKARDKQVVCLIWAQAPFTQAARPGSCASLRPLGQTHQSSVVFQNRASRRTVGRLIADCRKLADDRPWIRRMNRTAPHVNCYLSGSYGGYDTEMGRRRPHTHAAATERLLFFSVQPLFSTRCQLFSICMGFSARTRLGRRCWRLQF